MALDPAALLLAAKHHAKKTTPEHRSSRLFAPLASLLANIGRRSAKGRAPHPDIRSASRTAHVESPIHGSRAAVPAPVPAGGISRKAESPQLAVPPSFEQRTAVATERARCARIIAHGINLGRVEQAGVFAFDTDLNVATAIAALNASASTTPTHRGPRLSQLMASVRVPNPGAGGESPEPSTAQMIVAAGMKRRGEL